jgi:hypothetical protein
MPRFLRWSSYGLRTKGLIVVGLPVVPLAVFWVIAITGYHQVDQPANTIGRSLVVQANVARRPERPARRGLRRSLRIPH